jgi:hypothetical protein
MAAQVHGKDFPTFLCKIRKIILPVLTGSTRAMNKKQRISMPDFFGLDFIHRQIFNFNFQQTIIAFFLEFAASFVMARMIPLSSWAGQKSKAEDRRETLSRKQ